MESKEPWRTLGELIYDMILARQVKTPEFASLVKYYGEKRVRELYQEEREKRRTASQTTADAPRID